MADITAENTTSGTKTVLFPVALEYTQSQSYDYDSAVATTTSQIDATVEGYANFAEALEPQGANEVFFHPGHLQLALCAEYDQPRGGLTAYLDSLLQQQFAAAQLQDDDFLGDVTPHISGLDTGLALGNAMTAVNTSDVRKNLFASLVACDASITDIGINNYNFPVEKIEYFEIIARISLSTTLNPRAPAPGVTGTSDGAVTMEVANGQQITVTTPVKTIKIRIENRPPV